MKHEEMHALLLLLLCHEARGNARIHEARGNARIPVIIIMS